MVSLWARPEGSVIAGVAPELDLLAISTLLIEGGSEPVGGSTPDDGSDVISVPNSIAEPLDVHSVGSLTTTISICSGVKCLTLAICGYSAKSCK